MESGATRWVVKLRFREIKGFPRYYVTADGRILSRHRYHVPVALKLDHSGRYKRIALYTEQGLMVRLSVHRLVLEAFGGAPPFDNAVCRHKDGNRDNNHISNLEWGTAKENVYDQIRHGTFPFTIPKATVDAIRYQYQQGGVTQKQLSNRYGVSLGQVSKIITYRQRSAQ